MANFSAMGRGVESACKANFYRESCKAAAKLDDLAGAVLAAPKGSPERREAMAAYLAAESEAARLAGLCNGVASA